MSGAPIAEREEYRVDVEVFEGPLDLLLYLIRRDEIEICDIEITRITSQYLEYVNLMRMLDLNVAGDFLVMAATLLLIKSRMLLPAEDRGEGEAEEPDPRWDLVRRLLEYKKFKDAARHLEGLAVERENMFDPGAPVAVYEPEPGVALKEVGLFDLISALNEVLKRLKPVEFEAIRDDRWTVADKMTAILERARQGGRFLFTDLFPPTANRNEIVCTFLALLELIRLRQVEAWQEREFGVIAIRPARIQAMAGNEG